MRSSPIAAEESPDQQVRTHGKQGRPYKDQATPIAIRNAPIRTRNAPSRTKSVPMMRRKIARTVTVVSCPPSRSASFPAPGGTRRLTPTARLLSVAAPSSSAIHACCKIGLAMPAAPRHPSGWTRHVARSWTRPAHDPRQPRANPCPGAIAAVGGPLRPVPPPSRHP